MKYIIPLAAVSALLPCYPVVAFVTPSPSTSGGTNTASTAFNVATLGDDVAQKSDARENSSASKDLERQRLKQALLGRLGGPTISSAQEDKNYAALFDPVLADPITKEPLSISYIGPILGGGASRSGVRVELSSSADSERIYEGRTNKYINLLEPASSSTSTWDQRRRQ